MDAQVAGENFDPMVFKSSLFIFPLMDGHISQIFCYCAFKGKTLLKHRYVCSQLAFAFEMKITCFKTTSKILKLPC